VFHTNVIVVSKTNILMLYDVLFFHVNGIKYQMSLNT